MRAVRACGHPDSGHRRTGDAEEAVHGAGLGAARDDAGVPCHRDDRGAVISAQVHLTAFTDLASLLAAVAALPEDARRFSLDLPLLVSLSTRYNSALSPL